MSSQSAVHHASAAHTPRRARIFAEAATVGQGIYQSFPNNVWAQRALFTLETFAVPLAFWFKPICVAVALFW